MQCKFCNTRCVKNGFQSNGTQRYLCKICKKSHQKTYAYNAYRNDTNLNIFKLVVNSCGIRDISRILEISELTITKRILKLAAYTKRPFIMEYGQVYEADEMHVRVRDKEHCYIAYAINRKTRQVIGFAVGGRSQEALSKAINPVLCLSPKRIHTDNCNGYPGIIPKAIHRISKVGQNIIERMHLTMRTHLKRLNRKTLCYTRNIKTLEAILKLYFWGSPAQINLVK
jgi:IS1 family transposase